MFWNYLISIGKALFVDFETSLFSAMMFILCCIKVWVQFMTKCRRKMAILVISFFDQPNHAFIKLNAFVGWNKLFYESLQSFKVKWLVVSVLWSYNWKSRIEPNWNKTNTTTFAFIRRSASYNLMPMASSTIKLSPKKQCMGIGYKGHIKIWVCIYRFKAQC